jgi:hypothetical protein
MGQYGLKQAQPSSLGWIRFVKVGPSVETCDSGKTCVVVHGNAIYQIPNLTELETYLKPPPW